MTNAYAVVALKPAMRGCPSNGYLRLVNVSSTSQLAAALDSAKAGDQIRLAAGVYSGGFATSVDGTANDPITICGVAGVWPKITGGTFKIRSNFLRFTGLLFEGPNNSQNSIGMIGVNNIHFSGNEVRNGDYHAGIAVDSTYNVEITFNYIHDNGHEHIDHGIYYRKQSGGGNIIANNIIAGNAGRGISLHDNLGGAINDAKVFHNTIVKNGSTGILVAINGGSGNLFANNVLVDNGWVFGYKQITMRSGSTSIVTNNIVWSSVLKHQGVGIENNLSGNTLSNNLILDPKFLNYANRDYHLQASSPAISLGNSNYAVAVDFDGYLRSAPADAGAYEAAGGITQPPTVTPPPPTVTPSPTPTPIATLTKKISAAADAYVSAGSLSANYGRKDALQVDAESGREAKRSYLKFSVSGVTAVKKATLRVYITSQGNSINGPSIYSSGSSWGETTINWSNKPALTSGVLDDKGALVAGTWVEYNVTAAVKVNGTFSFALIATSDDSAFFNSREASSNRPELVIEYN